MLRYFGLAMTDADNDGDNDIISGRYWYRNPGGDMTATWQRTEFPVNADACLTMDINGNGRTDVIGQSLPEVYWLEAKDNSGLEWDTLIIGRIPASDHRNGQGFRIADVFKGGKKEILIATNGGIYCFEIPGNPGKDKWPVTLIARTESSEGFDVADIDRDGSPDLVAGDLPDQDSKNPTVLKWYKNPGLKTGDWKSFILGTTTNSIDRVCVADLDKNRIPDVIVTEELYPGLEPDASLYFFRGRKKSGKVYWERNILIKQYSMNNLDIGDIDNDGDPDIITNEHKGQAHKTQIFSNEGKGVFKEVLIDTGKESHLGTQLADMDNDGDLDIVSIAWDNYKYLHLWRNDRITSKK